MALSTLKILQLPQKVTSRVRELQWGMDWYEKCHKEAKAHEELTWKLYDDAIENKDARVQIESLYVVAEMFKANRIAAWREWQECKRQYLEMMN